MRDITLCCKQILHLIVPKAHLSPPKLTDNPPSITSKGTVQFQSTNLGAQERTHVFIFCILPGLLFLKLKLWKPNLGSLRAACAFQSYMLPPLLTTDGACCWSEHGWGAKKYKR